MNLSQHFTLAELTHTEQRRLSNALPPDLLPALTETAQMMQRIRGALSQHIGADVPIIVTSAYRSPAVNAAVGGSPRSDHMRAMAVDFKAPKFGSPYDVCKFLAPLINDLGIGQLIHEFGRWIHVSRSTPAKPVNRAITISAAGTQVGIQKVAL